MKYYAGIGTRRRTPEYILNIMIRVASKLESLGYILRSGGAQGCDKAFEAGIKNSKNKEIFRPSHATFEAIVMASEHHPYWECCNEYARKLHGRNSMILLGDNLKKPVQFVICHTADGKNSGGTGLGINIAESNNIPVFNLFYKSTRERIEKFIGTQEKVDLL